jgi:hypothetical protein
MFNLSQPSRTPEQRRRLEFGGLQTAGPAKRNERSKNMKKLISILAWVVGMASAFVLFAEPTAEIFPLQIMAGAVICAIFIAIRNQDKEGVYA